MTKEMSFTCDWCGAAVFGHYPPEWRIIRVYKAEPDNGKDDPEFTGDICPSCLDRMTGFAAAPTGLRL